MTYATIEEAINSGITNMTAFRNGSKQDDGTDAISAPSWLVVNNLQLNTVYVSGNTWFGLENGQSTENLRVNRRDAASYYVYFEDCVIQGIRCFKIRWRGYSYYSTSSSSALLIYDVYLCDNDKIFLNIINRPTSYTDGTCSLTLAGNTVNFDMWSNDNILFSRNADETYSVTYELPVFMKSYYLFRSQLNNNIFKYDVDTYSYVDLGSITLDSDLFISDGVEQLPDIVGVFENNLDILVWDDLDDVTHKYNLSATPVEQEFIIKDIDMVGVNSRGIKKIFSEFEGEPKIVLSVDNGVTYYYFDISNSEWVLSQSSTQSNTLKEATEFTKEQLHELCLDNTVLYIKIIFTGLNQVLKSLDLEI